MVTRSDRFDGQPNRFSELALPTNSGAYCFGSVGSEGRLAGTRAQLVGVRVGLVRLVWRAGVARAHVDPGQAHGATAHHRIVFVEHAGSVPTGTPPETANRAWR